MSQPFLLPIRRPIFRRLRLFGLTLLAIAVVALPSRGDVVILKDGYTIHGKVITEQSSFFDNLTGEQIVTKKMNGLTMVNDGPRLTVFSVNYKRVGDVDPYNKFADYINVVRPIAKGYQKYPLPPVMQFVKGTEFNAAWQRELTFANPPQPRNPYRITQQIEFITPHYTCFNSTTHQWTAFYLTSELGPEKVRKLLSTHPDFIENGGKAAAVKQAELMVTSTAFAPLLRLADAGKRARLIRFLIQCEWLNEAESEVDRMIKDLPAETKRADEFRETIRDLRLEKAIADIERAKESGQHNFARQALKTIPRDKLSAKQALKIAGLKAEYDAMTSKFDKAQGYLKELRKQVKAGTFQDLLQGADIVSSEMQIDAVSRLELFIALAEQAETALRDKKPVRDKPEMLLAAAINGWLMGNTATETDLATARKRLKAREVSLKYLRESLSPIRRDLLVNYFRDTDSLKFDELEKLISLLPPPEAGKVIPTAEVTRKTERLPTLDVGVSYLLKLPPEYQHTRSYPLLIVLPQGDERPEAVLKKLGDMPARYGFIVAIIDWTAAFGTTYSYTEDEQLLVTGALRHLRRTLQVDSDRVFVFGQGQGANFALDLGATHPDLFAGVVPMNPTPDPQYYNVFSVWKNFQNLPVYMIVGDRAGDAIKTIREILTNWTRNGFPALAVSYKGRGFEWFGEELPYVFDWMSRKTRATTFPDMGQFCTIRAGNNRFYWISTDEIDKGCVFDPQKRNRQFSLATVQARFNSNVITVDEMRMKQISIWLGKGTADFAKPISVSITGHGTAWTKSLTPKIDVLLEDLYERGDRQRPYYQRIDCNLSAWLPKFSAQ